MVIKCPHCQESFEPTDNEYAAIISQIRTAEFETQLQQRLAEITELNKVQQEKHDIQVQKEAEHALSEKDRQISELQKEVERIKGVLDNHEAVKKADLATAEAEATRQMSTLAAEKDKEIAELRSKLKNIETRHELDLTNERNSLNDELHQRDQTITELNSKLESQKLAAENKEMELREQHKILIQAKEEEIERYKDMKAKLSTKMLGETLEQHCQTAFNIARSQGAYRSAYFEKDNDASSGTKGDFIFRDFIDGQECLSIMFEMKNEDDRTAIKHKNEDFFAKLDKDRREKGCEYAVLVSMLEQDNELYNEGIVDVSYRYKKMYVIRPQFFMSLISLLSQSSKRGAETLISLRRELEVAKAQSIDVTKFEERRDKFAGEFLKYVKAHQEKHGEAIAAIDKAIEDAEKQISKLRKIKSLFETSNQKLIRAGEVIENDFTIKKLTHGNPTMRAKFDEVRTIRAAQNDVIPSETDA